MRSVCSRGVGEYQPKATLGAASDGAVDDVAGSLAVSGRSSIQHIDARDITEGRGALTGEVGCPDLWEATVKQRCCLETVLP